MTRDTLRRLGLKGALLLSTLWLALAHDIVHALECDARETRIVPVLYGPSPERDARARQVVADLLARVAQRSRALGAARLLADAEAAEARRVAAAGLPRLNLSASATRLGQEVPGLPRLEGNEGVAAVDLGAPLYDGGRLASLTEAQRQQAEAARLDARALQRELERLTLAAALERSRYYKHEQVLAQHAARMDCLARGLESIAQADPGRASEAVQAQKSVQQVALQRERARRAKQDAELRLIQLVGEPLPELEGLTTILRESPPPVLLERGAREAAEIRRLEAQVRVEQARLQALRAEGGPQLDWSVRHARTAGLSESTEWRATVVLNLPLFDAGRRHAIDAAAMRGSAWQERVEDALSARLAELAQVRAQAEDAFARMEDVDAVLENSDRLRDFTIRQWRELGRRSLFDVMSAEGDHYGLRIAQVDALHDGQRAVARLWAIGPGLQAWLDGTAPSDDNPPATR